MSTDEELLAKIKAGDEDAENELLSRYKDTVTKISRGYFLVGAELEDIVQEGMIGLYKAIKGYDAKQKEATFKTYAIVCIKHQIQSAIKKANALKNNPLSTAVSFQNFGSNENAEFLPVEFVLTDSPDEQIINRENLEEMEKTIKSTLTPMEIKTLNAYLQGYSYREIAEKFGKSRKAVDNTLSRIKLKLKTRFASYFSDKKEGKN